MKKTVQAAILFAAVVFDPATKSHDVEETEGGVVQCASVIDAEEQLKEMGFTRPGYSCIYWRKGAEYARILG